MLSLFERLFSRSGIALSILACNVLMAVAPVPQTIEIANSAEPKDLDPHLAVGVPEARIMRNLFEGLVSKDPKTLEIIPALAKSWTLSQEGSVYTFKIRKNARWSNGDPITADDFVFSFTRLANPATASDWSMFAEQIKNGKKILNKEITDLSQLGVKAKTPDTLEITLERPIPYALGLLAHISFAALNRKAIEAHGTKWTRPENIITSGAYTIEKWITNKIITLKPNPQYWDASRVKIQQANFLPVEKSETVEKMFRAKKIHIGDRVPTERIPFWKKDSSGSYQEIPYLGVYFYQFNVTKPPLDNAKVRKALNLAIDRTKVVTFVSRGGEMPATFYTPPGTGGFKPKTKLPSDLSRLDEAKKLLAEAGFPGGKGMPPIEIVYNTDENHKKIAEAIQEMLKKNLGVQVTLINREWKVFLSSINAHDFQVSRKGWIADYNDPSSFFSLFVSGASLNNTLYSSKTFDDVVAAADRERDQKRRLLLFQKAEDILMEDLPLMPIYIYTRVYLKSPVVVGWHNNIEDFHPLKYVSLSGKL